MFYFFLVANILFIRTKEEEAHNVILTRAKDQ